MDVLVLMVYIWIKRVIRGKLTNSLVNIHLLWSKNLIPLLQ